VGSPTTLGREPMELHASIHEDDDGMFWADVRELPGCFASGATISELTDALLEAVGMCLEDAPAKGAAAGAPRVRARVEEMTLTTV
jgi:predicted RNase H-like HicB family nuclease